MKKKSQKMQNAVNQEEKQDMKNNDQVESQKELAKQQKKRRKVQEQQQQSKKSSSRLLKKATLKKQYTNAKKKSLFDMDAKNRLIKQVRMWQDKQDRIQQRFEAQQKLNLQQKNNRELTKLLKDLFRKKNEQEIMSMNQEIVRKNKILHRVNGDKGQAEILEKEYNLQSFLKTTKTEEELKIDKARHHWNILKKKKKIIVMIGNTNDDMVKTILNEKQK